MLQSMGSQRVGQDRVTELKEHTGTLLNEEIIFISCLTLCPHWLGIKHQVNYEYTLLTADFTVFKL